MNAPHHWLRPASPLIGALALALVATGVVTTPAIPVQAATTPCTSTPFVSVPSKKAWYRIPALVKTDTAIVAFAERRDNDSTADRGDYDIVARTSRDGGCSWSAMVVVANAGKNHLSSPVPIWDPYTHSLMLFSSLRSTKDVYLGLHMQRSTDNGLTWSSLSTGRITATVAYHGQWKGGLQGPGHGLVLQHGSYAGRIIFPMGYVKTIKGTKRYGTYGVYSDDGGSTWRIGYDTLAPGKVQLIEGTLAELPDGRVLVSYRDKRKTKPGTNRFSAIATKGGTVLTSGYRKMVGVKTMAVEGALLQPTGTSALLLFSGPSFIKTRNLTIRRDMTIFVSTNNGTSWRKGPLIGTKKGLPAAYSDLVQIDSNTVGILYETGVKKWREKIAFVQVPLSTLR